MVERGGTAIVTKLPFCVRSPGCGLSRVTARGQARGAGPGWIAILALVALRLIAAAYTPITFDEAYYWMWSKHLAGGYYDHPPMVAVVIRLGTLIAGDTEFGVRLVSILLALPMSFAVYRSAEILFGGRRVAATATILLNVTLMAAVALADAIAAFIPVVPAIKWPNDIFWNDRKAGGILISLLIVIYLGWALRRRVAVGRK